jgi:hypothetical protein
VPADPALVRSLRFACKRRARIQLQGSLLNLLILLTQYRVSISNRALTSRSPVVDGFYTVGRQTQIVGTNLFCRHVGAPVAEDR